VQLKFMHMANAFKTSIKGITVSTNTTIICHAELIIWNNDELTNMMYRCSEIIIHC